MLLRFPLLSIFANHLLFNLRLHSCININIDAVSPPNETVKHQSMMQQPMPQPMIIQAGVSEAQPAEAITKQPQPEGKKVQSSKEPTQTTCPNCHQVRKLLKLRSNRFDFHLKQRIWNKIRSLSLYML